MATTLNTSSLESSLQSCIDALTSSATSCDLLLTSISSNSVDNINFCSAVATTNDLPDLSTNCISPGTIIFVDCLNIPVVATCYEWLGLDKRILRTDISKCNLWTWGSGQDGRLGIGDTFDRCSPVREISSSCDWCFISLDMACNVHAIKADGGLWGWGSGANGVLGDGTTISKCSPVREISCSTNWSFVSSGGSGGVAIKTDGSLWSWGSGNCGVLGDGTTVSKCSPVREISSSTWCKVAASDPGNAAPHIVAIKTDGSLWSWGYGVRGGLGDGTTVDKCSPVREISSDTTWCQLSAGRGLSIALKTDGTLWTWGCAGGGALGDGTTVCKCSPVREITSSTTWCQGSAGGFTVAAIKTDGTLWTWGCNFSGQLGNGATVNRCSPVREITSSTTWCIVSAGEAHVAAIKTDGSLFAWGSNTSGTLGNGALLDRCSPVREITSSTDWRSVSGGSGHTVGVKIM